MSQTKKNLKNLCRKSSLTHFKGRKTSVYAISKEAPFYASFRASLTVEAAVTIPLFVCFAVAILFFFQVMCTQIQVQTALNHTGRLLAEYACTEKRQNASGSVAAKGIFLVQLQRQKVRTGDIVGGYPGIEIKRTSDGEDMLCLQASYRLRLPVNVFGRIRLPVRQFVKVRKWTGETSLNETGEWVYITPTGSVYHMTTACPSLSLNIHTVTGGELDKARNRSGGKYYECPRCKSSAPAGVYYITEYGGSYHKSIQCSGLKRSIQRIRIEDAGSRRKCRRCGG